MAGRLRGAGGSRVLAVIALGAILAAMACGDDPSEPVVVGDGTTTVTSSPEAAELALPRCRDVPEVDPAPVPPDPSSDPEVAAWQEQRAGVGLPSDEASTLAAAAAEAEAPVEDLGFPMTAEEADRFFGHQESNGELATLVQEAVGHERSGTSMTASSPPWPGSMSSKSAGAGTARCTVEPPSMPAMVAHESGTSTPSPAGPSSTSTSSKAPGRCSNRTWSAVPAARRLTGIGNRVNVVRAAGSRPVAPARGPSAARSTESARDTSDSGSTSPIRDGQRSSNCRCSAAD